MFTSNLNQRSYLQIIIDTLLPWAIGRFGADWILHQDNDPKHTSRLCREFLIFERVLWVRSLKSFILKTFNKLKLFKKKCESPAQSPDLNPIEMVWADMKAFVASRFCRNLHEVKIQKDLNPREMFKVY